MSPEPSFTQSLREEGFIQGSDVVTEANKAKEEVVNAVDNEVQNVERLQILSHWEQMHLKCIIFKYVFYT